MESKLRIPRLASAVLVLGGACGDEEKKSPLATQGIDTSPARVDAVAEAFCKVSSACGEDTRTELSDCKASVDFYFERYIEPNTNDDCADAMLDYYACYASLSCAELQDEESTAGFECWLKARIEDRCEGQLDDDPEDPPPPAD